jgi:hypothetical protein
MAVIREFDHDGDHYEILSEIGDEEWIVRLMVGGRSVASIQIPDETARDARVEHGDVVLSMANELEHMAKEMYNFTVTPIVLR